MEDGISAVLSEESVSEGLSIQQMNDYLGTFYIDDLDENARKEQILHLVPMLIHQILQIVPYRHYK